MELQSLPEGHVQVRRPGMVTLIPEKPSDLLYRTSHSGLRYLGKTQGYSMDMSFVESDPFVVEAVDALWGGIPPELDGYSRSGANLSRLYDSLARYDIDHHPLPFDDPDFQDAVSIAKMAFSPGEKVKPLAIDDVTFKPDTSAGWTFMGSRKGEVELEARSEAKRLSRLSRRGRLSKRSLPPAVAFVRTQLAPVDQPKVRLVWGIPFEVILWEGQFIEALLRAYESRSIPMPYGITVLKELPMLIDNLFLYGKGVGLDWSGFDGTQSPAALHLAYKLLKEFLDLSAEQSVEYDRFVDYSIRTPIVMPNGGMYLKVGGIASGLYSTQLVGSLLNFIYQIYLQKKMFGTFYRTHVLGDDAAFSVPMHTEVDLERLARIAQSKLGLKLNVAKSIVAETPEDFVFLGHGAENGKVSRDSDKLLALALYPERETRGPNHAVSRVQGILIDSGFKDHRLFRIYQYLVNKYKDAAPMTERYLKVVFKVDVPPGWRPVEDLWLHS